jgi:hypothetical protein
MDPDRAVAGYFDIANRQAGRLDRLRYSDDFGGFNAPIASAHANTHGDSPVRVEHGAASAFCCLVVCGPVAQDTPEPEGGAGELQIKTRLPNVNSVAQTFPAKLSFGGSLTLPLTRLRDFASLTPGHIAIDMCGTIRAHIPASQLHFSTQNAFRVLAPGNSSASRIGRRLE